MSNKASNQFDEMCGMFCQTNFFLNDKTNYLAHPGDNEFSGLRNLTR